jgi:hypothetical protein
MWSCANLPDPTKLIRTQILMIALLSHWDASRKLVQLLDARYRYGWHGHEAKHGRAR